MKVYILEAVEEYEGSRIVAVYRSQKSAAKRQARLKAERGRYLQGLEFENSGKFSEFVGYSNFLICQYRLLP